MESGQLKNMILKNKNETVDSQVFIAQIAELKDSDNKRNVLGLK